MYPVTASPRLVQEQGITLPPGLKDHSGLRGALLQGNGRTSYGSLYS